MARKEQAATAPLPEGANKASVVVSFPDGSRWLMELTPLQPTALTQLPTLTQVANLAPIQTDGSAEPQTAAIDLSTTTKGNGLEQIQSTISDGASILDTSVSESALPVTADQTEAVLNGSEQIQSAVAEESHSSGLSADSVAEAADIGSPVSASAGIAERPAVAVPTGTNSESSEPALRTIELYFVDTRGRRMTFESATIYRGNRWRVDDFARARLGLGPTEGCGLGGEPGRWREFYPHKDPGECGFVDNIGVLCWEDGDGRAYAAEAGLLSAALGPTWRERIRSLLVARTADGADRC